VPKGAFPWSTQVCVPVLQEVMPVLQGAPGLVLHVWPATQGTHAPEPSHTLFVPQEVPAGFGAPSTHVCAPVLHDVTPYRQAAFGLVVHDCPAVHDTQLPEPSHTLLVPQLVPAATFVVESTHTSAPVLHDVVPTLHGLGFELHVNPAVHATQLPEPLHTRLVPQLVPAGL
jgi:hypothetical protein